MKLQKLTILVPAYNESKNLEPVLKKAIKSIKTIDNLDLDILIVDDCSTENMYGLFSSIENVPVNWIRLAKNVGGNMADHAGLHYTKSDAVLIISADGQETPEVLPEMIREWQNGHKVIWGCRYDRKDEHFFSKVFCVNFLRNFTVIYW